MTDTGFFGQLINSDSWERWPRVCNAGCDFLRRALHAVRADRQGVQDAAGAAGGTREGRAEVP